MTEWISVVGATFFGLASLIVAWSALRPRQRIFAKRLVSLWAERAMVLLSICYFLWVNISFAMKSSPISRMDVLLLVVANAETVFLLALYLITHVFSAFLDKRNLRWEAMTKRVERLEQSHAHQSRNSKSADQRTAPAVPVPD